MGRVVRGLLFGFFALVLLPSSVHAQAAIAGVVRDASGGVLPGVTVEASSPALIEKVRTAVSDGTGQYRIEDLRPGIYTVRFTLGGFSSVSREGVELTGSTTATISVDMRVGAVEETITVTGETPVVDVQGSKRQAVLTNEVINAIPSAGSYNALLVLVPSLFGGQQDVSTGPCNSCTFSAHGTLLSGGRANTEARLLVDGISIAVPQAGGTNYLTDPRNSQEVNFTISGSLGEVESGGPVMNIVPKSGGNTLTASAFMSWANGDLQGNNITDELAAQRITPSPLIKSYDVDTSIGFPVVKDRLWFFGTVRAQGNSAYITNMYYNKNAGNPNAWLYVKDESRQAFNDKTWQNASGRITAQVTPRNKVNVFWDEQQVCKSCENGGNYANATTSPEANGYGDLHPMRFQQATWTSPYNNKLLLEGGFGYFFSRWGGRAKENPNTEALVRVIEQCTALVNGQPCPANGGIPNLMYRSQTTDLFSDGRNKNITTTWRAVASYVTGRQSLKVGYTANQLGDIRSANRGSNDLRYRTNNGIPNQLTQFIHNQQNDLWMRNHALFVQDQWTFGRFTLAGALRYDHAASWAPEQRLESRFWNAPLSWERTPVVDAYNDITPRVSVAYDVFGDGKTAVKANLGKYLESTVTASNYGLGNPTSRIATNVTRTWTDANADWVPDCDLKNQQAQGPATAVYGGGGPDFCGVISNLNFGTSNFSNTIDPDILKGWGVRPSDWDWGVEVQQEVLPRVSVSVGFFHREFFGFTVTDNLAIAPEDYSKFNITAPQDSRLPDGGGYSVGPIYDLNVPSLFGVTRNYITYSDRYGDQYQKFNGIDVSFNARPRNGITVQGGFSGGYATSDNCAVRDKVPEIALLNPFCHVETSFMPQYKGLGSYVVPKVDVQISATFTSKPGINVSGFGTPQQGGAFAANWTVSNAIVSQILGRNLSGNAANITVNILEPYATLGDRVNELDLRFQKILRFGKTRANVGVDIFNVLNGSAALSYNQAFIPNGPWLTPTSILSARFAKISAQFDF